jgi:hypothetical protein
MVSNVPHDIVIGNQSGAVAQNQPRFASSDRATYRVRLLRLRKLETTVEHSDWFW